MQMVIKIPKKDYDKMCKGELIDTILVAIKNGTPLPKGHGRLIDADAFISNHFGNVARLVDDAPTIIDADKAESEG